MKPPGLHPSLDRGHLELLERVEFVSALEDALAAVLAGSGRMVFIGGEAGVGKTALLREFCARVSSARVLWGTCERLFTPRALGPFLDIADGFGGELADAARDRATAHELLSALVAELRRAQAAVLVIEDVHWADEGTLDVLNLLARRLAGLSVLVLVSFRDDQLGPGDQLRMVLGELAGVRDVERLRIPPLSLAAVRALAEASGADARQLFEKTSGNPFFVTEALAAVDVEIPETVRDAVLARVGHLGPAARRLLEAVAVVPSSAELWLVEAVAGDELGELDSCLSSGVLRHEEGWISFRHELARMAVEETIGPTRRRHLHGLVLMALTTSPPEAVDPARISHHADAAGDGDAVLRYAPAAGDRAAALSAHRQAAQQYALALRHAERLSDERRAELWERLSYEYYLTQEFAEAISARRSALAVHQARGDHVSEGDDHRWLSRLAWFAGDPASAALEGRRAVELLEREPPGRELAMAYSNSAQLCVLAGDVSGTVAWGGRAIELADRLGETEVLAHALNNVGTAEMGAGVPDGRAKIERSLALALEHGLEEHVARAYTNLGSTLVAHREYEAAERYLVAGIAYTEEHDLDSWRIYMSGWMARLRFEQGRWNEAAEGAAAVLRDPRVPVPSRITPLVVLGRLRARVGDSDPWALLDEALELAQRTSELQRLGLVAAARAEACWLQGEGARVAAETAATLALARARGDRWVLGELAIWRRRAGLDEAVDLGAVAPPFTLELSGQWPAAAELWNQIGCPYETALALAETEEEPALREALAQFQRLGAAPAGRATAQRLRRLGVRRIERGPRRSTAKNPGQLTARQVEILALLADGMTNAEIAARLFITPKTVEHHVSAILAKLGVASRKQAAAEAARLGVSQR
ncbi:MAG TPA: AAA family ATPase [Solirubrobacteraceae bacterium]|nr:AAA family ATPase [Solirubrobacteraceae bacterium]